MSTLTKQIRAIIREHWSLDDGYSRDVLAEEIAKFVSERKERQPMGHEFRFYLPQVDPMGDVMDQAVAEAIKAQYEHLERQWRQIIVDALRREVGSAADHCADLVIKALSEHQTVFRLSDLHIRAE